LKKNILALMCLLLAVFNTYAAFTIEPAVVLMFADKGEKTAFVELVHTGGGPAAVQFSVLERTLDMDGLLVKEGGAKSADFVLHPKEVILYPNERATVQVQYKGKGKITSDKAYVLYSQEVPLNLEKEEESGVEMAVTMLTNYYTVLALDTGKPGKLVFVSSKSIGGGKIEVIAENKGAGRVKSERIGLVVSGSVVKSFTGKSNSIMPGTKRRFTFEWPRAVTDKEIKFVY
jgi:P pilus assembly chaperone PapD